MTFRNPSFQNKPATTFQAGDTAGLQMWVQSTQSNCNPDNLVYGRITDTGNNFVVEGARISDNRWVQIPCRRLLDAKLHLADVMDRETFQAFRDLFAEAEKVQTVIWLNTNAIIQGFSTFMKEIWFTYPKCPRYKIYYRK